MKNKTVAGILALFLGGFGIHKFYLRDTGAGIFYVILFFASINIFSFPISQLLGFLDAFRLFTMSEEKFDRKYNSNKRSRPSRRQRRQERKSNRYEPPKARRKVRVEDRPVAKRTKANPFKRTGIAKYKDFDIDEAIVDFNKGLELDPNDIALHFNIACAYSLTEEKDKAFRHLDEAVRLGFKDFAKIRTHDDLAFLRIQEGFEEFEENGFRLVKAAPKNTETSDALLAQLNKLSELRKKGYLSEKEFELRKELLLRR